VITSRKIFICKHQIAVSGDISDFAGDAVDEVEKTWQNLNGSLSDYGDNAYKEANYTFEEAKKWVEDQ
jgi:hypothetical protein